MKVTKVIQKVKRVLTPKGKVKKLRSTLENAAEKMMFNSKVSK